MIARRSMSVGRLPLGDGVTTNGARATHGSSVRSVASLRWSGSTRTVRYDGLLLIRTAWLLS